MTPEHGTRARYLRDCRCQDCRDANATYVKHYRYRARVRGPRATRPVRIPAAPVVTHVTALLASGWTLCSISRETGMDTGYLSRLARGMFPTTHPRVAALLVELAPLAPVPVDEVIVARIVAGESHRALGANRAERIAALRIIADRARRHADPFGGALPPGVESINDASRRLALHMSRDVRKKETA